MDGCGFLDKEPQINADERRYQFNREAFELNYGQGISKILQKMQSFMMLYFSFFASLTMGCFKIRYGTISAFICVHPRLINLKGPFQAPEYIVKLQGREI
jgi:hypothetical protein